MLPGEIPSIVDFIIASRYNICPGAHSAEYHLATLIVCNVAAVGENAYRLNGIHFKGLRICTWQFVMFSPMFPVCRVLVISLPALFSFSCRELNP